MSESNTTEGNAVESSKVKMQIKRWDTGAVIFEGEFESMKACVLAAIASSANLRYANLSSANLRYADLSSANLSSANLSYANLSSANLSYAKNSELAVAMTRVVAEGSIIGWKKCNAGVIVKLRIPEAAKRSNAWGRKCRAEYAEVLEVIGADVGVTSNHGPRTEYRVGQTVRPDSFDDDFSYECSNGIHFFITRAEAEAYA